MASDNWNLQGKKKKRTILPELDKTVDSKESRKEENMPWDVVVSVIWPGQAAHGDSGFTSSLCGCPLMWPLSCFSFLGLVCKRKGHSLWALFLWDAETLFPEGPEWQDVIRGLWQGAVCPRLYLFLEVLLQQGVGWRSWRGSSSPSMHPKYRTGLRGC